MKIAGIEYTLAFWLLRIWLSVRAIFTGLVKFQGMKNVVKAEFADFTPEEVEALGEEAFDKVPGLGLDLYQALPARGPMSIDSFQSSPFMPEFAVVPYAATLGYALVILGVMLLLGVCTRITLFLQGLLYVSLTFGFIILEKSLGQDSGAGAAYLGVHIIMIAMALVLSKYNKFELLKCGSLPCCKCDSEK